jgi:hypothetical protein
MFRASVVISFLLSWKDIKLQMYLALGTRINIVVIL